MAENRRSRGIAGTVAVAAFIVVLTAVGIGRSILPLGGTARPPSQPDRDGAVGSIAMTETVEVERIDRLVIEGAWQVEILDSDDWRGVRVTTGGTGREADAIQRRGDSIVLQHPGGLARLEAAVSVSDIDRLDIDGTASVVLGGMQLDRLELTVDGAGSVEARDVVVNTLAVDTDGAASINFLGATVTDADVDVDGVGQVLLGMAGGTLSGSIDGAGRIEYEGTVEAQDVDIDGIGSVGPRRR